MSEEIKTEQQEQTVKAEKVKKKNKKDEEITLLKAKLEEEHNLLLRTAAEFDNFKKRTEREKLSIGEYAKTDILKKLLPIIDNIARADGMDRENPEYIKGIEMIIKQLTAITETLGVTPIANVGDEFDPNLHDAVMHIDDESLGKNVISQVLQQGYKLGDTVIRPAMVQVAN